MLHKEVLKCREREEKEKRLKELGKGGAIRLLYLFTVRTVLFYFSLALVSERDAATI